MHGFYLFTVGGPGAVVPPSAPAAIAGSDGVGLDAGGVAVALAHWLVLAASALWTGVVALEVLVLFPSRAGTRDGQPSLASLGSRRARGVIRVGLQATLLASALELAAQAAAATGAWSGAISAGVLRDVLSTGYGTYLGLRVVLAIGALLVLRGVGSGRQARCAAASALGYRTGRALAALGLAYLLALALSGHAGALPHMAITSVALDWLHLLAMAVWVGGMAAIAVLLVPMRERRCEFLALLDRFSPAAYVALLAAAATGMFNAQVRITGLDTLTGTLYGRLLLLKLALIAAIMALSASHVFVTRPRLRMAVPGSLGDVTARAYASLAVRLRLEPALGALVLLCVALMGQVAPSASAFNAVVLQVSGDAGSAVVGGPITATGALGDLTVNLEINPADVGQTQLTAAVSEHGRRVTDGQVRIKLSLPADPGLGAAFVETAPEAGSYDGEGDLVQEGLWQADVLVRTRDDPGEYRAIPFVFLASAEPALLSASATDTRNGPATVRLISRPGAAARLAVLLHPGLRVRYLLTMPDMSPQPDNVQPETHGWYSGIIVPPMEGYMNLAVQVQEGAAWHTMRTMVCEVDSALALHLLL
jgi:copper transport protein